MRSRRSAPVRDIGLVSPRCPDQRFSTIVRCALLDFPPALAVTLIFAIADFFLAIPFLSDLSAFLGTSSLIVALPAFEKCFLTVLNLYTFAAPFGRLSVPPAGGAQAPVPLTVTRIAFFCLRGFCLPAPARVSSDDRVLPPAPGPPEPPEPLMLGLPVLLPFAPAE